MKSLLVLIALITTGNAAHADVITCHQTEPFITDVIDTEARTLKQTMMGEPMASYKDIKIVIKAGGQIEFRSKKDRLLRTIDLTKEGSDGMSDIVYPISSTAQNGMWGGGCETSELKRRGDGN